MPLAKDLMPFFPAGQAGAIGGQVNSAVTAAGTTQGTATAITATGNVVTAGGLNTGVQLYNGVIGDSQWVFNNQLVAIVVYPPTSGKINQLAANAGTALGANTYANFRKVTATQWIEELSA